MTTIKFMQASLAAVLLLALTSACPALDSAASLAAKPYDRAVARQRLHRPVTTPFPKENPFSVERAALGKVLFFDPRLSGGNSIACASCHNPGFSWGDGLPKAVGHVAVARRSRGRIPLEGDFKTFETLS